MRNQKVATMMRKKYNTITGDRCPLTVFAVSNCDYERHKEEDGYGLSGEIPLSVGATGIPYVRRQLSVLPAKARLDTLTNYCHSIVEDLIGSLHNWSTESTMQRRTELETLVAKPRNVSNRLSASSNSKRLIMSYIGDRNRSRQV